MSDDSAPEGFIARSAATIKPEQVSEIEFGKYSYEIVENSREAIFPNFYIAIWHFEQKSGRDAFVKAISEGKFRKRAAP